MRRRRFLGGLTAGCALTAGCLGRRSETQAGSQPPEDGGIQPPATLEETELPVPEDELRQPLPRDHIPAITDPAFAADWSQLDAASYDEPVPDDGELRLPGDAPVLGVHRNGESRAYPLRVLNWHEVVNDEFGGPVAVTYCVLCGSGVVVERVVDGEPTVFGVSGKLWKSDLVMYDQATDSLWSQLLATAIRGEKTGTRLRILPSTLTTWDEWQERQPETSVLLPPPESNTVEGRDETFDYFEPRYGYDEESQLVGRDSVDGGLYDKTMVVGVSHDGTARAYPYHVVNAETVVEDSVAGKPVVVTVGPADTLAAYDRRVDGRALSFDPDGERHLAGGGSRWERTTGRAVDGPFDGQRLDRANDHLPMFWLGWQNFNPETDVYGIDAE